MSSDTSSTTASTTSVSTPTTTTTSAEAKTISPTPENIDRFAHVISSAFYSTPLTTIFISEIDSRGDISQALAADSVSAPPFSHARRYQHFYPGIHSAATAGAELVEAGDWSAIALWESPTFQGKPFVEAREIRGEIFSEWRDSVRRMKATHLGATQTSPSQTSPDNRPWPRQLRPFYHLSFLARDPDALAVSGAISAVVLPFLQRAREEGVPCWLEATSPHAVAIYEHFGFKVCEEVVVGKGNCDGRGYPCIGDEATGVKAWGMIWEESKR